MIASWLRPLTLIVTTLIALALVFLLPATPVHGVLILAFLLTCPGLMLVAPLHLPDRVSEWGIALATSIAFDTFIACFFLYSRHFSSEGIMATIATLTIVGSIVQFPTIAGLFRRTFSTLARSL
jgi:hypothetical protein